MKSFALTDVGKKRSVNQDSVFATNTSIGTLPNLFVVCDGMGGEAAGDYASATTIEAIVESISNASSTEPVDVLEQAILSANEKVYRESIADPSKFGMGTTVVMATIVEGHLFVANVGDSRLYVATAAGLTQVTRDHSVVAELLRLGRITPEEAKTHKDRSKITRAVGAEEIVIPEFFDVELSGKENILLCSDGLTNMVSEDELNYELIFSDEPQAKAQRLVELANKHGGADNISAIVISI